MFCLQLTTAIVIVQVWQGIRPQIYLHNPLGHSQDMGPVSQSFEFIIQISEVLLLIGKGWSDQITILHTPWHLNWDSN